MMKLYYLLYLCFASQALANMKEKRQSSVDMSYILSQVSEFTSKYPATPTTYSFPAVTIGGNLQQPPASLVGAIITAVPASVLAELAIPSLRSSIASEFKAGHTPEWYQTLPTAVKSYIESLETQIAAGAVNLSATLTSTFQFPVQTTTGTVKGTVKGSSTSKAGAAQVTGGIGLSVGAGLGMLGVMIAL